MSEQQAIQALIARPTYQIETEQQEAEESANLIVLRKARKELEAKYKELKKPFKDGLAQLDDEFAKVVDPIKRTEEQINRAILTWKQAEAVRIAKVKAEADRLQREAEAAARRAKQPPPPPPMPVVESAKGWATDRGSVTTRKIPKWRVVDESAIPLEMDIDGERVRLWEVIGAAVTKVRGKYGDKPSPIPGIEFYYEEGLSVR